MAQVTGTPYDDIIGVGTASVGVEPATGATYENDTIAGLSGADTLAGGSGSDDFQFDPSNPSEGKDVIEDFTLHEANDSFKLDYIALNSAQLIAADPGLPGADGDATSLSLVDFDASPNWNLSSSTGVISIGNHNDVRDNDVHDNSTSVVSIGNYNDVHDNDVHDNLTGIVSIGNYNDVHDNDVHDNYGGGWLLIEHPGGSIEFAGIPFNAVASFNDLAPSLKVDDAIWSGPIDLILE